MISFSDWNKKDKNTDYEIVKSRSGLPMFVLKPPESVLIIPDDDDPVLLDDDPVSRPKTKSIPQQVSDYITRHF
jgi:hypothetical protein